MKKKAPRPISGIIKHATIVMGGTQHRAATSFTPSKLGMSERTKLFREQGIVWISPTRGKIYTPVVCAWLSFQWPQNHFRSPLVATSNMEVAAAYNALVHTSMDTKNLIKGYGHYGKVFAEAPFILSTEEDNVPPQDGIVRLLEAIMTCPDCGKEVGGDAWKCENGHQGYDAVSGLYFIKTDPPVPMAFGAPTFNKKKMNFHPVSVAAAIKKGSVIEVNGIAMGFALFRKALFKRVKNTPKNPWFKTIPGMTQDLYFCKRAKLEAHARFGVHCGVKVGHFDPNSGECY